MLNDGQKTRQKNRFTKEQKAEVWHAGTSHNSLILILLSEQQDDFQTENTETGLYLVWKSQDNKNRKGTNTQVSCTHQNSDNSQHHTSHVVFQLPVRQRAVQAVDWVPRRQLHYTHKHTQTHKMVRFADIMDTGVRFTEINCREGKRQIHFDHMQEIEMKRFKNNQSTSLWSRRNVYLKSQSRNEIHQHVC